LDIFISHFIFILSCSKVLKKRIDWHKKKSSGTFRSELFVYGVLDDVPSIKRER